MKFVEYKSRHCGRTLFLDKQPPKIKLLDITLNQLLQHPLIKSKHKPEYIDFKFCWKPDHQMWHKSALYCTWIEPVTKRFRWNLLGYADEFLKELPLIEWPKTDDLRRRKRK